MVGKIILSHLVQLLLKVMSHCYLVTQLAETKEVLTHQVSSDMCTIYAFM